MIPEDLRYTEDHEWIRVAGGDTVQVGITDYAQRQLGDVVFVDLPQVGQRIEPGAPVGEIESTKAVSDLFAPAAGEVTAVNEDLDSAPELVNSDPYGDGWIFEVRTEKDSAQALSELLDAAAYRSLTEQG